MLFEQQFYMTTCETSKIYKQNVSLNTKTKAKERENEI